MMSIEEFAPVWVRGARDGSGSFSYFVSKEFRESSCSMCRAYACTQQVRDYGARDSEGRPQYAILHGYHLMLA